MVPGSRVVVESGTLQPAPSVGDAWRVRKRNDAEMEREGRVEMLYYC